MRIEHVAVWTDSLERLKAFYVKYFGAAAGNKYSNPAKGFESYFLSFSGGARLELMSLAAGLTAGAAGDAPRAGLAHLAISAGDRETVVKLTAALGRDGFTVLSAPRQTGDGYFESLVLDPDGNRVEIAA